MTAVPRAAQTKTARHRRIVEILRHGAVRSQAELAVDALHDAFPLRRCHRRLPGTAALVVDVGDVAFLDVTRVQQHGAAQVAGGVGAVDSARETLFDQVGNIAAMVNMGVGEHHGINFSGVKGEVQVDAV